MLSSTLSISLVSCKSHDNSTVRTDPYNSGGLSVLIMADAGPSPESSTCGEIDAKALLVERDQLRSEIEAQNMQIKLRNNQLKVMKEEFSRRDKNNGLYHQFKQAQNDRNRANAMTAFFRDKQKRAGFKILDKVLWRRQQARCTEHVRRWKNSASSSGKSSQIDKVQLVTTLLLGHHIERGQTIIQGILRRWDQTIVTQRFSCWRISFITSKLEERMRHIELIDSAFEKSAKDLEEELELKVEEISALKNNLKEEKSDCSQAMLHLGEYQLKV